MRVLCLLILVVLVGAVVVFAVQNEQPVTLTFFPNYGVTTSVAVLAGAAYLLGMVSGWTVVGMLRRSFERVTEFPESRRQRAW